MILNAPLINCVMTLLHHSWIPVANKQPCGWRLRRLSWVRLLALGIISACLTAVPVDAAEKIFFKYGPLLRSLQISSLEAFAKDGTVNSDLAFYFWLARANETEQAEFREALQESADIDPILLSRFFYTKIGENILTQFGQGLKTRAGLNGKLSLRAALTQAALDPEGLSLLNFLRHLPTDMQFDIDQALKLERTVERVVEATKSSIETIRALSAEEAATEPSVDFSTLSDLSQAGPLGVEQRRLVLTDESRQRQFYLDLYQPQRWRPGKTPVIVHSHGLASNPESRRRQAAHMASYGYVVALPQHPGSDSIQVENFQAGLSSQIFLTTEFIDRPQDISYVIDELERRNQSEFGGRLDLENVGIAGHSFGGYTALAVAGAEIDFEHLETDCSRLFAYLNTSLLLQCEALNLPRQAYNFRDPRVQAVAVGNPVNSSIFGPDGLSQIQIPALILAGSHDPATPAVFEQFRTFPWLTTPTKYLGLVEGQAHVDLSELDSGITQVIDSVPGLTLASPDVVRTYFEAMGLAFFEVYISRKVDYQLYLRSSYAAHLSQGEPFKLYLISAVSDQEVVRPLEERPLLPDQPQP